MPVIKREAETFTRVLDAIAMYGSLTKASAAAGIAPFTLARWRRASEDGDENFQEVDYRGVIAPLHVHVEETIEQSIDEIESNFRGSSRDGLWRAVLWHGSYVYETSEAASRMSEAELADAVDLGLEWPDRLKRVLNPTTGEWERVKIMEWIPPSTEAQLAVLRSWSDRYADRRSLKVEGNINATLGVSIIGASGRPPPPQLEIITPQIVDAVNDAATDATFAEIDDEEPEAMVAAPLPEPDPTSPLTAEQQAILARARSSNPLAVELAQRAMARTAAAPTPPAAPVYRGDDPDDSAPRTPRGSKVV